MAVGLSCRLCGRANTGGNLTTYLDVLTSEVSLVEDGYVFQNPFWHRKMIPSPEDFELIVGVKKQGEGWVGGLLHMNKKPNKAGKLELTQTLEPKTDKHEVTVISLNPQKFKYKWIHTDTILCICPTEYKKWFEQATFMLRMVNEPLPYFGWLRQALETRYTNANYRRDKKTGEWKEMENAPGEPKEGKPTAEDLAFLARAWEICIKYTDDFTYTFEQMRVAMYDDNRTYYNEVRAVVAEFNDNGTWANQLKDTKNPLLKESRLLTFIEMEKLKKHIEKKLDHTRKDYELYLPKKFTRVNDERMLITMEKDFIYEWWPKTYALQGMWQFSKRPLTKKQIEEWNERKVGDITIKEPLKTCVFCPSDTNKVGDDYAFDNWPLLLSDEGVRKDAEQAKREFSNAIMAQNAHGFSEALADLVEDQEELGKLTDDQIKQLTETAKQLASVSAVPADIQSDITTSVQKLDKEMANRGKADELKNKLREEREADLARQEEIRNRLVDLDREIQQARDSNNTNRANELQQDLDHQRNLAENVNRSLDLNNERIGDMADTVNRNTENFRNSQQRMRELLEELNRRHNDRNS
jgi:hypothetical protein